MCANQRERESVCVANHEHINKRTGFSLSKSELFLAFKEDVLKRKIMVL